MIQMAGHKPWAGIKTKMTPEMKLNAIAEAESLAQEMLSQKMDKDSRSLPEEASRPKVYSEVKTQAYVH